MVGKIFGLKLIMMLALCISSVFSMLKAGEIHFKKSEIEIMKTKQFQKEFAFMLSNSEGCWGDRPELCSRIGKRWVDDLSIGIIQNNDVDRVVSQIVPGIRYFIENFTEQTGVGAKLTKKGINLAIYFVDDIIDKRIMAGEYPVDVTFYENDSRLILKQYVNCSGYSNITPDNEIVSANIFIPSAMTDELLDACVKEELFNLTGLLADPLGKASLFDSHYYKSRNRKVNKIGIEYAKEHLLMLRLLYSLHANHLTNIKEFVDSIDE